MRHVILGTAGHIDHGKSSLVKALTGVDPDRLKEEKERGITIDLGFAQLDFEDNLSVGIVDVPGHERLIKNMLAGAGGIDLVLMVIAADEGIMPQSREHLSICNMLKIKTGIVAITKADLVDSDWLEMVMEEVRGFVKGTFLDSCPIVPVSSATAENIDKLKSVIHEVAIACEVKTSGGLFRLPVDRVFTLKGFGTVVTGTVLSGAISLDEQVEVLPSGIRTKVRGLHSHGRPVKNIVAGQRGAINLQGVEKEDLCRGDSVVSAGRFKLTKKIDAYLELLPGDNELKTRSQVHFYLATSETVARVILYGQEVLGQGQGCYCQLRLNDPVLSQACDRFIIRRFSPLETLGGGEVLDPAPARRRRRDGIADLEILNLGTLEDRVAEKIRKAALDGITRNEIEAWIKTETASIRDAVGTLKGARKILKIDDLFVHEESFAVFRDKLTGLLRDFHDSNPMKPGMPKEEARVRLKASPKIFGGLMDMVDGVESHKGLLLLKGFAVAVSDKEKDALIDEIERRGFEPPSIPEIAAAVGINERQASDILRILGSEDRVKRLSDSLYMGVNAYDRMIGIIRHHYAQNDAMTVAEFRDILKTTRKYALPLLEYMDSSGITLRVGDIRKLLKK